MTAYLIDIDMARATNPELVLDIIRRLPTSFPGPKSTWIVETDQSAQQVFDTLSPYFAENSGLLICEICGSLVWDASDESIKRWLSARIIGG